MLSSASAAQAHCSSQRRSGLFVGSSEISLIVRRYVQLGLHASVLDLDDPGDCRAVPAAASRTLGFAYRLWENTLGTKLFGLQGRALEP
jgi:hypothetical protein